jgi:hypothetical protein
LKIVRAYSFFCFQSGKSGVVLPVREIGEVMFADFFRQLVAPKSDEGGSFAGGRVQALPFFQRRVICQRDGKSLRRFSMGFSLKIRQTILPKFVE